MDEKMILGITLGMIGGALIVANSSKAKSAVKEGQTMIKEKVNGLTKKQKTK